MERKTTKGLSTCNVNYRQSTQQGGTENTLVQLVTFTHWSSAEHTSQDRTFAAVGSSPRRIVRAVLSKFSAIFLKWCERGNNRVVQRSWSRMHATSPISNSRSTQICSHLRSREYKTLSAKSSRDHLPHCERHWINTKASQFRCLHYRSRVESPFVTNRFEWSRCDVTSHRFTAPDGLQLSFPGTRSFWALQVCLTLDASALCPF